MEVEESGVVVGRIDDDRGGAGAILHTTHVGVSRV